MILKILGTTWMVLGIVYVTIGFFSQVLKNKREKQMGWSKLLFILTYITYILGIAYAILAKDYYVLGPYLIGFPFLNIFLYQMIKYRKK